MKILPTLLAHSLIALLVFSLSACSSHHKQSAFQQSGGVATDSQDEEIASAEPEETAQEELEELNKPGAWEYGVNKTYSLEKMEIKNKIPKQSKQRNQILLLVILFVKS